MRITDPLVNQFVSIRFRGETRRVRDDGKGHQREEF